MPKLKVPAGTGNVGVDGVEYKVDKNGFVDVSDANHINTLQRLGYVTERDLPTIEVKAPVEPEKTDAPEADKKPAGKK